MTHAHNFTGKMVHGYAKYQWHWSMKVQYASPTCRHCGLSWAMYEYLEEAKERAKA